jgi:hypothetical protein
MLTLSLFVLLEAKPGNAEALAAFLPHAGSATRQSRVKTRRSGSRSGLVRPRLRSSTRFAMKPGDRPI